LQYRLHVARCSDESTGGINCYSSKFLPVFPPQISVVKLPVIYSGGKLLVTYWPLAADMGHQTLVLKGWDSHYD